MPAKDLEHDALVYKRLRSSIVGIVGTYLYVIHFEGEDPTDIVRACAHGYAEEHMTRIGGPFATTEEAKAVGAKALEDLMVRLDEQGIRTTRPGKA
jgi:hypothetical protein